MASEWELRILQDFLETKTIEELRAMVITMSQSGRPASLVAALAAAHQRIAELQEELDFEQEMAV